MLETRPDPAALPDAIHEAYQVLAREREKFERHARQLRVAGAPLTFGGALDAWWDDELKRNAFDTPAGRVWAERRKRGVDKALGALELTQLAGPAGHELLNAWVRGLLDDAAPARPGAGRGRAPGTVRDLVNVAMRALHFAHRRGWLNVAPGKPRIVVRRRRAVRAEWLSEAQLEPLTAALFADSEQWLRPYVPDPAERVEYVETKRDYVRALLYSGSHVSDVEDFPRSRLFLEEGFWLRVNTKSASHVRDDLVEIPENWKPHLRKLLLRRGAAPPSAQLFGGRWGSRWPVLERARKKVGIPFRLNNHVVRRSCAVHLFLAGYGKDYIANYLGHASTEMVDEVYLAIKPLIERGRSRWTGNVAGKARPLPAAGKVAADEAAARPLRVVRDEGEGVG